MRAQVVVNTGGGRYRSAFWSPAQVTIPAGQTAINAQLNGHNAGTTHITATDNAGTVYATATPVLAVQATMRLTTGGYALNATDQLSTQVLLSDPSPVGGTFVTFNYSTAGIASVSPSPAFIPAGQLAANIVISGVAAGTTNNITPVAIGVNGTASSFTTYAAVLTFTSTNLRLGTGQFEPNVAGGGADVRGQPGARDVHELRHDDRHGDRRRVNSERPVLHVSDDHRGGPRRRDDQGERSGVDARGTDNAHGHDAAPSGCAASRATQRPRRRSSTRCTPKTRRNRFTIKRVRSWCT